MRLSVVDLRRVECRETGCSALRLVRNLQWRDRMQTPLDITFRSMDPSPAVEESIQRWVARLDAWYDIERCAVVIEVPHRHHRQGKTFQVHLTVTVSERTIAISRDPGVDHGHENVYVAIGDAFRAARRQLHDFSQIRRGDVKAHA